MKMTRKALLKPPPISFRSLIVRHRLSLTLVAHKLPLDTFHFSCPFSCSKVIRIYGLQIPGLACLGSECKLFPRPKEGSPWKKAQGTQQRCTRRAMRLHNAALIHKARAEKVEKGERRNKQKKIQQKQAPSLSTVDK